MESTLLHNTGGRIVDHTAAAVTTLHELGGNFNETFTTDMANPVAPFAWPLVMYSYVIWTLDKTRQLRSAAIAGGQPDSNAGELAFAA